MSATENGYAFGAKNQREAKGYPQLRQTLSTPPNPGICSGEKFSSYG